VDRIAGPENAEEENLLSLPETEPVTQDSKENSTCTFQ
jgi:hypothetical protein